MLDLALSVLAEQSTPGLMLMFFYVVMLELPRYGFSVVAFAVSPARRQQSVCFSKFSPRVSIMAVGLNEGDCIEKCVHSLRAQSYKNLEIVIVSDGSSDNMPKIARDLVRKGLVEKALATDRRCGKSSGVNLAYRYTSGEIIINVDCDCSYDRFAIERIVAQFADDPSVGAAVGDIIPRNGNMSLIATIQVIEYLLCISLGKRVAAVFDQVVCASGAFSAFRRAAIDDVGFLDPGGGEDLDVTLRLRRRGWRIAFAADAFCYTDVPVTDWALIRQRMRWERDAVRVRYRKNRRTCLPSSQTFTVAEAVHQIDFLLFSVLLGITFPLYLLFLYFEMGASVGFMLLAAHLGMMLLDTVIFLIAVLTTGRWDFLGYLFYVPAYSIFNTTVMRAVRVVAYVQEWAFDGSRGDAHYVPLRVQQARRW
jgi:cellulose synthase/poly-beta-1,6-N-acetylglucosamine synthase-like glycosyltransferase